MFNNECEKISQTITDSLRRAGQVDSLYTKSVALAYLAYVSEPRDYQDNKDFSFVKARIRDKTANHVFDLLRDVPFETFLPLQSFSKKALLEYIKTAEDSSGRTSGEFSTPESLVKLGLAILDIRKGENVLDNCAGVGTFLTSAYNKNPGAEYNGVEMNTSAIAIARIKSKVIGGEINIVQGDALDENFSGKTFDKVFSNYPFGMQVRFLNNGAYHLNQIKMRCPELSKATSSDWIFNYQLVNSLKDTGTGIAIMTLGGLWNTIDKPIRKFFIMNSYIRTIISLPAKLFSSTNVPLAMVVFSKQFNKTVRMIDASDLFVEGRRINTLSEENVLTIVDLMSRDSEISKTVSHNDIIDNDYVLNPTRYMTEAIKVKNGVEFSKLIETIKRGAPISARELDTMVSKEPTDFQYLMLSNIKKGIIDEELPYLKTIKPQYERFCVKDGSLLLSKNGFPFKVAIAQVQEGKKLLANGNLYIIELKNKLIKPYYLKAFLESEKGIAILKSISVGATMPNIGVDQLKHIQIPMEPMDRQEAIENQYRAYLDEINLLNRKIAKAESSLKTLFE